MSCKFTLLSGAEMILTTFVYYSRGPLVINNSDLFWHTEPWHNLQIYVASQEFYCVYECGVREGVFLLEGEGYFVYLFLFLLPPLDLLTHQSIKALLLSIHNICFHGETKKKQNTCLPVATIFNLITTHTPISAQSSNFLSLQITAHALLSTSLNKRMLWAFIWITTKSQGNSEYQQYIYKNKIRKNIPLYALLDSPLMRSSAKLF